MALKNKQNVFTGWLRGPVVAGRSCSPASGLGISSYIHLLTFFPHVQDVGKLVFFLSLPCPVPAIREGWGMGRSFVSNPHSPSEERGRLTKSYFFVRDLPGFFAKMVCSSLQAPHLLLLVAVATGTIQAIISNVAILPLFNLHHPPYNLASLSSVYGIRHITSQSRRCSYA